MSDNNERPKPTVTPLFEVGFAKKVQERIEEGKKNTDAVLRQVMLQRILREAIEKRG